jgi:uncharacterized RDD family membrane protein YckC
MERPEGIPVLASWGRRLAAYLIDNLVLLLANVPGFAILIAGVARTPDSTGLVVLGGALIVLSVFVAPAIYFTMLHGRSGQTLGKRWLRLRVVDAETGAAIGYGRAFGRWLLVTVLNFFCGLLGLLDGLWPLWDQQNQTWHDKAVSTVVVKLPA